MRVSAAVFISLFAVQGVDATANPLTCTDLGNGLADCTISAHTFAPEGQHAWSAGSDGTLAFQSLSGTASMYHVPVTLFESFELGAANWIGGTPQGTGWSARITRIDTSFEVLSNSGDGFIGFALGIDPGEVTAPVDPNYILVDWKQRDGGGATQGLRATHVTDPAFGFWGHSDGDPIQLTRNSLTSTGWDAFKVNAFRFLLDDDGVEVLVKREGASAYSPQFDFLFDDLTAAGPTDGGFALYSNRQNAIRFEAPQFVVTYEALDLQVAPRNDSVFAAVTAPPAAGVMLGCALYLLSLRRVHDAA